MNEQANAGPGYGSGGGYGPPPGGGGGGYGGPPGYGGGGYGGPPPPPPPGGFGGPFGPPGPQMPGPMGPGYGYGGPPESSNGLAVGSLICGIFALPTTCCCSIASFPFAIAAIIMGVIAMSKAKSEPQVYGGGKNMAIAGLACGALAIVMAIALLALGMGQALIEQYQRS